MVDKIELSLDDIIKSNKSTKGGRGGFRGRNASSGGGSGVKKVGGGLRQGGGGSAPRRQGSTAGVLKGRNQGGIQKAKFNRSRGDVNSAWKHDLYDGPKRGGRIGGVAAGIKSTAKLLVSNLDYGVSESDIHELFADFGPLKSASVHYDRSGRSLGTADVVFERRSDAIKAMKQYNGVPLDGRPMNIQMATSDLPTISKGRIGGGGAPGNRVNQRSPRRTPGGPPPRRGGAGGGAGAGQRRNAGGNTRKPTKTAEELDAELDAYVNDMKI